MASGNSSDPPGRRNSNGFGRRNSNGQRRLSGINTEDQVAQQTEEVFRSYAFYRYQQEREESTEEMPMDPEIAEIQQEPGSTSSLVGRRLAIIGDDINARYDAEFRNMLKSLQPTKDNAYEYFTRIASSHAALSSQLCRPEAQPTGKLTSVTLPPVLLNVVVVVPSSTSANCPLCPWHAL
ncbi:PREDICTED: bcl-2 homologous antagonist/killer isoform X2 [Crocodylus porosus]|uniref:bcl-2 homologous antagonist/killer isoform X2 n=1 Tax=Crocodylus porosus TaxID=8502 RepID=UPI00093CD2E2|nr:PREDICTED: bcl-2 homologous antagonist/killer isoform X2 [Crocodylus porosus]